MRLSLLIPHRFPVRATPAHCTGIVSLRMCSSPNALRSLVAKAWHQRISKLTFHLNSQWQKSWLPALDWSFPCRIKLRIKAREVEPYLCMGSSSRSPREARSAHPSRPVARDFRVEVHQYIVRRAKAVCVWVFGCLGVWVFGCLGVWVFGCLGIDVSTRISTNAQSRA